jgi:hypothetical protein
VTWGLIGLAALRALFGRGGRRTSWVGATFFGAGYMMFAFGFPPGWASGPQEAADQFLSGLRSRDPRPATIVPASSYSVAVANTRIQQALEMRVPMRFKTTPLEDVLKYIQEAPTGPGRRLPIYVDPVALNMAEKTLTSPVSIDVEDAPLRSTLPIVLRQLDLMYSVREGVLWIVCASDYNEVFPGAPHDPFLTIAHCAVALLAATLGGLAVPRIACPQVGAGRVEPTSQDSRARSGQADCP